MDPSSRMPMPSLPPKPITNEEPASVSPASAEAYYQRRAGIRIPRPLPAPNHIVLLNYRNDCQAPLAYMALGAGRKGLSLTGLTELIAAACHVPSFVNAELWKSSSKNDMDYRSLMASMQKHKHAYVKT